MKVHGLDANIKQCEGVWKGSSIPLNGVIKKHLFQFD